MEIEVTAHGDATVVTPSGVIDGKAAFAFERKLVELLDARATRLVIDLGQVTLITSAGIRALVMAARRLRGAGALALCRLGPPVRGVFDVAGLTGHFTIADTLAEAVAAVAAAHAQRPAVARSRVVRLLDRLLGSGEASAPAVPRGSASALATTVARLMARQ